MDMLSEQEVARASAMSCESACLQADMDIIGGRDQREDAVRGPTEKGGMKEKGSLSNRERQFKWATRVCLCFEGENNTVVV